MKNRYFLILGAFIMMLNQVIIAQVSPSVTDSTKTIPPPEESVFEMSLEDLLNVEVTSVSKKAEKLQNVASSIYVLSSDDIARSGATNLIELFRQVPGFWGTQEEYNNGSGTMRFSAPENGFIGSVLYLLDGTPIQELMSSSVTFRNLDIPFDEIDRIEFIRGSGGTIYGANSATGVVNIFTKDPSKYDTKLNIKVESATNGYLVGSARAGGKVTDKLAISGYGKFRHFNGYGPMNGFDGNFVTVPKNDGSGDTTIVNRFNQNFEEQLMVSGGLKANYDFTDKTRLSFHSHFNTLNKGEYSNSYPAAFYGQRDILYHTNVNTLRLTSNIRLDHSFNDNHSIFVRLSNNHENDFIRLGGGYKVNNGIYDLEIQDNIKIGKINDLSFGLNYRRVSFDINHINDPTTIGYVDPQAKESLKGLFVQDKLSFMDGKLNVIAGVKAEQYTLVNNNFYFSPNLKLSYIPNDKLTFWGGFTQSYTTPGFNLTNIDLTILKAPAYGFFYGQVAPQVAKGVRDGVYQNLKNNGADDATANAQADAYIQSPAGQAAIYTNADPTTKQLAAPYTNGTFAIGVKNGSKTVPTRFQTFEFGVRSSNLSKTSIESNFFYTILTDGIAASPTSNLRAQPSLTQSGQIVDYYTYGNNLKGTSLGNESMIKTKLLSFLTLEGSLTWLQTKMEYQKNPDFDINSLSSTERDQTPSVPVMPQFIWRFKTYLDLPKDFYLTASVIYATKSYTQTTYQYQFQRYTPILGSQGLVIATNSSRTIFNFKVEKKFMDKKLSVYVFGNDVFNDGLLETSARITNVTLSQIKAMYGLGINYNF